MEGSGHRAPPWVAEYNVPFDFSNRRFAPAWRWTLLAVAGVALFSSLGRWQLHRAAEKRAQDASFAAGDAEAVPLPAGFATVARFRRARVSGHYDAAHQFLLDNMTHEDVPGVQVLTPLVRADGSVVIVNRGFVPTSGDRRVLPDVSVGSGPRVVTGRVDELPRPAISLASPAGHGWPRRLSFPRIADLAAILHVPTYPQVLLLDRGEPDGYLRDWHPLGLTAERHLGYAIQWFGLALAVAVTWLVLSFRPRTPAR